MTSHHKQLLWMNRHAESMLSRAEMSALYEGFKTKHQAASHLVRPTLLPHVDHAVFGNLENESLHGWIPSSKGVTILLCEAPPWKYQAELKSPYFYSSESGSGQSPSSMIFKGLDIRTDKKPQGLQDFKGAGYLLLDSIKCPIDSKLTRRTHKVELEDLVNISRKIVSNESDELIAHDRQIRCVVASGNTALKLMDVFCHNDGGLPIGDLKNWMAKWPGGKAVMSRYAPVLPWFLPSGRNPLADSSFDGGRLKKAINLCLDP